MKVLVTGHKGYIGKHLYYNLKNMGHNVDGIDLKDGKDVLQCLPDKPYDYVFHMAAIPKVSFCVSQSRSYPFPYIAAEELNITLFTPCF